MEASDLRFAYLLGHEKPKALLREAVAKNKMGHAYLFRGPDGVGKKRTALTLAAYINCKSPLGGDSCGRCNVCRKYFSANHPDLILVEPDGAAIKIGQIRKLKHQLTFSPLEARVRVVILEDIVDKQGTLTTETTFRTSWALPELEHGAGAIGIAANGF